MIVVAYITACTLSNVTLVCNCAAQEVAVKSGDISAPSRTPVVRRAGVITGVSLFVAHDLSLEQSFVCVPHTEY